MYNLAYLTQTGQGTAKNEKKAIQLYQDAANKGYPVAHYVLAKNYVTGTLGLPQDINKAKQHFEAASKLGFDDATVEYAVLLFSENKPESEKLALKKLEPLVKKGNYQAIHAQALYDISTGFKNKQEAPIQKGLNSIQDLAKKGYIPALMAVGNMFANGNIIPQNLPEAKKIFTALAKENVPQAKESLAQVETMMANQAKSACNSSSQKINRFFKKYSQLRVFFYHQRPIKTLTTTKLNSVLIISGVSAFSFKPYTCPKIPNREGIGKAAIKVPA